MDIYTEYIIKRKKTGKDYAIITLTVIAAIILSFFGIVFNPLIFGIGCGVITFVIRKYAALPEGVSYSILLMNILVPHINRISVKKPFGFVSPKKEVKADE